ncbi:MAG: ABC transporter [Burkholderiales bacterium]|jgi:iron complex transport system ATP-binding protein|nr:MAG: ABC transporter [Burkholderiales bacterium]
MTELLRTVALAFGYQRHALTRPIDLSLHGGEIVVVLGPNGSGKSTLFRTLLGIVAPVAGEVRWAGRPLAQHSPRELAECVAWVPQSPGAAFEFTVEQYVMLGRLGRLAAGAAPARADRAAVARAIERLGLQDFRERPLSRMSGGERQLAAVARALAQEASTLVLDEPTTSLDFGNQGRVLDVIASLADDGLGIVYSTHDPNHARRAGTRALVYLPEGETAFGAVDELVEPATLSRVYGVPVDGAHTADGRLVLAIAPALGGRFNR